MNNKNDFKADVRYSKLSRVVIDMLDTLDNKLVERGYLYKAIWRNDKESGGNVFTFKAENPKCN